LEIEATAHDSVTEAFMTVNRPEMQKPVDGRRAGV
jgi:hypothetical protein